MYDTFAEDYLEHARDGAFKALYDRPAVLEVLGPVDGLQVLDLGCGPGLYTEELIRRGAAHVVGVDASAVMVRLARERIAARVSFHCQGLQEPLSWAADEEFDVAVMPLVIHHLDDRKRESHWVCASTDENAAGRDAGSREPDRCCSVPS
jgi:2-polyprenyl-3-methyl-5-hydroxy-6-metoxy-1,4-benzoquinol methylase